METKTFAVRKQGAGYLVTDGIWISRTYSTREQARQAMRAAMWGERGADGHGITGDAEKDPTCILCDSGEEPGHEH